MKEIVLFIVIIFILITFIYRLKKFSPKNFRVSLKMTVVVFLAIEVYILVINGGIKFQLASDSFVMIDELLHFNKAIGSFFGEDINSRYIYAQPVGFVLVLHIALCTLGIFFDKSLEKFSGVILGYFHIGYFIIAIILYLFQLWFFEKLYTSYYELYAFFILTSCCFCFAGLYSFFGIFSSIVSAYTLIKIIFSGIKMYSFGAAIWECIFSMMHIHSRVLQVVILVISIIITSWDTLFEHLFGTTNFYDKISNFFESNIIN